MAVQKNAGNLPHIYWIDLKGDGVYTECAVMKEDGLGNVFFFPLKSLDTIDKKRLARILSNRNAVHFELWDLMSNITLNNGVNALTYFHQLVQVVTPGGQVMKPQEGVIGVGTGGIIDTRSADARREVSEQVDVAVNAAAAAAAQAAAAAVYQATNPVPAAQQAAPAPAAKAPAKKKAAKKTS